MIFDIKYFYSSISKKLLDDSIKFARQHMQIKKEDLSIIQHARKSTPLQQGNSVAKEKHQPF